MKLCTNASQIKTALKQVNPSKIAVAFVGGGWRKYISLPHLREIILSPSFGSNPEAIEEIMAKIGHENTHFLDDLHAKIYIGSKSAFLGSSNLSDNGFTQREAGVLLQTKSSLRSLETTFAHFRAAAEEAYPTKLSKMVKLRELQKEWQIAVSHRIIKLKKGSGAPDLADFNGNRYRIHVCWYNSNGLKYNEKAISASIPDTNDTGAENYFTNCLNFLEEDKIKCGDWVLQWMCNGDGFPRPNGNISWLFIHHVVSHGIKDINYTKLAGQAKSKYQVCPPVPFELTVRTKQLIRGTLKLKRFRRLLHIPDKEDEWNMAAADAIVPEFISRLRAVQNILQSGEPQSSA